MSDRHAGMTLGKITVQAATSDKRELATFAFGSIHLVVHQSALQTYEGL